MPALNNSIVIEENGGITIEDATGGCIKINVDNPNEALKQLKQLNELQIDSLLQIADQQKKSLTELFRAILQSTANEKNVIKGSISHVQTMKIGDEVHYHYYASQASLPKELTLSIPKTDPRDIVGREEDLQGLHELLSKEQRVVVVNGMGGIGKSTLAQAYVYRYYEEYKHIVWVSQTSENVAEGFMDDGGLTKTLSIKTANLEPTQVFEEILRKLKSIEERPNLLVIDNGEQSLCKYRNLLPTQPNWHLLVTSRAEIEGFNLMTLGFLSEDQAIELFYRHYPFKTLSEHDIRELVKAVDYHTLTIEILSKTAKLHRYDAATLRGGIEQDLRANIEVPHSGESGRVERVGSYLSAIFNLSRLNEEEIWLLKQFTCLPAEFHTFDLLRELLVGEGSPYGETFSENLSLLAQKGWLLQDTAKDSYKMHRIVAEVVKREQPANFDDVQVLAIAITKRLGLDYTNDNPVDKFIWIPFGRALLTNIGDNESQPLVASLQNNLASVLQHYGNYEEAKAYFEKVVTFYEVIYRPYHPITARAYSNLALILKDLGNFQGAKSLLEKAVLWSENSLGENHPNTAQRYSNLASVIHSLGDAEGAKVIWEKAVLINEQVFGEDHLTTISNYANLAVVHQELGNKTMAKELSIKATQTTEKHLGKDHPSTAISYSNLAMLLWELGEYGEARPLLESVMYSHERNFGIYHPNTSKSYSNLSIVLQELGELEEAKLLLQKAVDADEKTLGKSHPDTARSYVNLGTVYRKVGDHSKALEFTKKALDIFQLTLPEGHPTIGKVKSMYERLLSQL